MSIGKMGLTIEEAATYTNIDFNGRQQIPLAKRTTSTTKDSKTPYNACGAYIILIIIIRKVKAILI